MIEIKEVAKTEGLALKSVYNVLSAIRDCEPKVWRGWQFKQIGRRWYAEKGSMPDKEAGRDGLREMGEVQGAGAGDMGVRDAQEGDTEEGTVGQEQGEEDAVSQESEVKEAGEDTKTAGCC